MGEIGTDKQTSVVSECLFLGHEMAHLLEILTEVFQNILVPAFKIPLNSLQNLLNINV